MPNLVDLFGQISLFAKLTMAVAIVAFGLAVAYVFRPTEQKLVLMRPVSLAAIFATVSGLLGGWIARARKHCSDAGWAPAGGDSLSRHRRITHRRLRLFRPARRRLDACGGRRGYDVTLLLHLELPLGILLPEVVVVARPDVELPARLERDGAVPVHLSVGTTTDWHHPAGGPSAGAASARRNPPFFSLPSPSLRRLNETDSGYHWREGYLIGLAPPRFPVSQSTTRIKRMSPSSPP